VAALIPADKDDTRCRIARWRFDELHVGIPSKGEQRALPRLRIHPPLYSSLCGCFDSRRSGDGLTHAANIFPAGYEFEGARTAIS
jgi:hypothetical protein